MFFNSNNDILQNDLETLGLENVIMPTIGTENIDEEINPINEEFTRIDEEVAPINNINHEEVAPINEEVAHIDEEVAPIDNINHEEVAPIDNINHEEVAPINGESALLESLNNQDVDNAVDNTIDKIFLQSFLDSQGNQVNSQDNQVDSQSNRADSQGSQVDASFKRIEDIKNVQNENINQDFDRNSIIKPTEASFQCSNISNAYGFVSIKDSKKNEIEAINLTNKQNEQSEQNVSSFVCIDNSNNSQLDISQKSKTSNSKNDSWVRPDINKTSSGEIHTNTLWKNDNKNHIMTKKTKILSKSFELVDNHKNELNYQKKLANKSFNDHNIHQTNYLDNQDTHIHRAIRINSITSIHKSEIQNDIQNDIQNNQNYPIVLNDTNDINLSNKAKDITLESKIIKIENFTTWVIESKIIKIENFTTGIIESKIIKNDNFTPKDTDCELESPSSLNFSEQDSSICDYSLNDSGVSSLKNLLIDEEIEDMINDDVNLYPKTIENLKYGSSDSDIDEIRSCSAKIEFLVLERPHTTDQFSYRIALCGSYVDKELCNIMPKVQKSFEEFNSHSKEKIFNKSEPMNSQTSEPMNSQTYEKNNEDNNSEMSISDLISQLSFQSETVVEKKLYQPEYNSMKQINNSMKDMKEKSFFCLEFQHISAVIQEKQKINEEQEVEKENEKQGAEKINETQESKSTEQVKSIEVDIDNHVTSVASNNIESNDRHVASNEDHVVKSIESNDDHVTSIASNNIESNDRHVSSNADHVASNADHIVESIDNHTASNIYNHVASNADHISSNADHIASNEVDMSNLSDEQEKQYIIKSSINHATSNKDTHHIMSKEKSVIRNEIFGENIKLFYKAINNNQSYIYQNLSKNSDTDYIAIMKSFFILKNSTTKEVGTKNLTLNNINNNVNFIFTPSAFSNNISAQYLVLLFSDIKIIQIDKPIIEINKSHEASMFPVKLSEFTSSYIPYTATELLKVYPEDQIKTYISKQSSVELQGNTKHSSYDFYESKTKFSEVNVLRSPASLKLAAPNITNMDLTFYIMYEKFRRRYMQTLY